MTSANFEHHSHNQLGRNSSQNDSANYHTAEAILIMVPTNNIRYYNDV